MCIGNNVYIIQEAQQYSNRKRCEQSCVGNVFIRSYILQQLIEIMRNVAKH